MPPGPLNEREINLLLKGKVKKLALVLWGGRLSDKQLSVGGLQGFGRRRLVTGELNTEKQAQRCCGQPSLSRAGFLSSPPLAQRRVLLNFAGGLKVNSAPIYV